MASGSRRRRSHRQARTSGGALRAPASLVRHARDAIHATGAGTVCPPPQRLQLLLPLPARVRLSAQTPSFATSTRGAEKRFFPSRCVARAGRATPCRQQAPTGVSGKLFPPSLILPLHTQRARHARTSSMAPSWRAQSGSQERVLLAARQPATPPPRVGHAPLHPTRCAPRREIKIARSPPRKVCGWGGATAAGLVGEVIMYWGTLSRISDFSFPETLQKGTFLSPSSPKG